MPITYDMIPLQGVGPVLLGMTRDESRAAMGVEPTTFRKTPADVQETDAYHNGALQVFFDDKGTVEYIELSRDEPSFVARYKGFDVFSTPAEELVSIIARDAPYDAGDPELGYSYIFPDIELALWRPVLPQESPRGLYFATVGIGRQGYFSESTAQ